MESDTWDFFDLDQEIHVAISEDGREYLKQFGLEEYNFENFEPLEGPGKYYDDVPLDENPEALLDILSRETHQRQSSRGERATAPPRPSPRKTTKEKPRRDSERRTDLGNDGALIKERHTATDDIQPQRSPAKTLPKKVSFSDRPARDEEAAFEVFPSSGKPAKVSRSAASFFGRPKTKALEKKTKSKIVPECHDSRNGAPASVEGLPALDGDILPHPRNGPGSNVEGALPDEVGLPTKGRGPSSPKKTRKFKFPGLELVLRAKGKVGNSVATEGTPTTLSPVEKQTKSDESPIRNHTRIRTQGDMPLTNPTFSDTNSNKEFRPTLGVEKLDLVKHSPELGTMKASAQQPTYGNVLHQYESENVTKIPQSEERTSVMSHTVHTLKPFARQESDMRIVEIVSTDPTEMTPEGAAMTDDMILGMEANLPPPLLAAVTGDVQLMRKAISDLSREELLSSRDGRGNTVLHVSAAGGYLPCVELLCTFCPQLLHAENKTHLTPTPMAIKHGQIEILDWMLENIDLRKEQRPPSASKRRSLLHHAARFGQDGCLRLLLSKMERTGSLSACVDQYGNTPACVDQYGNTPAHMAAKYGHLTCIQSLVEYGMDVCSPNQQGHTPCYYADFGNHRHCAGYLVVVETCAQLTNEHVTQTAEHERLHAAMSVSKTFIKEALDLCSIISRQSTEQVDARCRLQQTLDESLDVISDMAGLLKDLYRQKCELKDRGNGPSQTSSPTCEGVQLSLERGADIQRRLEALENIINPHASRQHMVRVKDLQRRWAAASEVKEVPSSDPTPKAKHLMKQRLSGSIQRLLVCRTTMRSAQLLNSQKITSTDEDDSLSAFKPKPRHNKPKPTPLYITQPTANNPVEIKNPQMPLSPLSPRARTNESVSSKNNGSKQKTNWFEEDEDSTASLTSDQDSSHHSLSSFRPTKGAFSRPSNSPEKVVALPKKIVKNNVVESFLNSRLFYQEDAPINNKQSVVAESPAGPGVGNTRGVTSKLWFYDGDASPDVDKTKEPTNKGLRTSAFSAFNRVSTNRNEEDAKPNQKISFTETKQKPSNLPKSLETYQNKSDTKASNSKTEVDVNDVRRVHKEHFNRGDSTANAVKEKDMHALLEAGQSDRDGKPPCDGPSLGPPETRLNVSYDDSNAAPEVTKKNSPKPATLWRSDTVVNESEDVVVSRLESNVPAPCPQSTPEEVLFSTSAPAQSAGEDSDALASEDSVSGVGLGAELDGDDLMLGSESYDDLEEEAGHDRHDLSELFSAEDLLALAANGRLPLSMQFETSLSTIDEVSVVSESTRTDGETSDGPMLDSSVDLEQTTDSDDTVTVPSEHAPSLPGDLDPQEAGEAKVHGANSKEDKQLEDDAKPWYEMSDDEEVITRSSGNSATRGRKEHFTLF